MLLVLMELEFGFRGKYPMTNTAAKELKRTGYTVLLDGSCVFEDFEFA